MARTVDTTEYPDLPGSSIADGPGEESRVMVFSFRKKDDKMEERTEGIL